MAFVAMALVAFQWWVFYRYWRWRLLDLWRWTKGEEMIHIIRDRIGAAFRKHLKDGSDYMHVFREETERGSKALEYAAKWLAAERSVKDGDRVVELHVTATLAMMAKIEWLAGRKNVTTADILRRAVALYAEAVEGEAQGLRVALVTANDDVVEELVGF